MKFFFLQFYGPGMLCLDFCFEGKGISQTRSQGLFPILSAGHTQDREKALGTRLGISKTARGSEVKIVQDYFGFQELPLA